MKRIGWLVCLLMLSSVHAWAAAEELQDGWRLESACKEKADGAAISVKSYSDAAWMHVRVPSTVLAAQVAARQVPDPYYGMNLRKIAGTTYPVGENFSNLPMAEDSPYHCGWWYRREFTAPALHGGRLWLHFGGINYRGEIWVNGKRVADGSVVAGAYRTYDFDVTDVVKAGAGNVLAVETFAPTENDLGINWVDWNPCPPDKDMGLWGAVSLESTGSVVVRSPMVTTHFADSSLDVAELTVEAMLENAADHAVKGVVSGTAAGVAFTRSVELAAHETKRVVVTPMDVPGLKVAHPAVWWPYQMGVPHLEDLTVSFRDEHGVTDAKSVRFGIREMTSELTPQGARLFRVNGKPILVRGAGWSQDMLLRTDSKKLREEFALVHDMHLNTIRLEGKLETDEFFHLADEQGVLVMLGWCCCDHWEKWDTWTPEDLKIATASLRAQLLRLRAHASLLVWLNGSDSAPPKNVEQAYLDVEKEVSWPNPVIAAASETTTLAGPSGVKMTGPYDYVAPSYWYVDEHHGGAFGFNTETSPGPAIPSLASREKFLPDAKAWPASETWSLHYGSEGFKTLKVMDEAMTAVYGGAANADDYERIAQTMAYDSERAMFEAYSRNKYASTGVVQWMLNNAWPSMIWHLYDYYLEGGAGYYAAKKACEPLHVQYGYDDHSVSVVNSTYKAVDGLRVSVRVYGVDWKELYHDDVPVKLDADGVARALKIPDSVFAAGEKVYFVRLEMSDAAHAVVSRNFYWVPAELTQFDWNKTNYTHTPAAKHEDMSALATLPKAVVHAEADVEELAHGRVVRVHLRNDAKALAFQLRVAARTASGGLIAPVMWSDNWIELAPGEERVLVAKLPADAPADAVVHVAGWNVAAQVLRLKAASPVLLKGSSPKLSKPLGGNGE